MTRLVKTLFIWLIISTAVFQKNTSASAIFGESPNEVIFLQTDRDFYIAGEHLFFSLELINFPKTNEALSQIAYLALRNQFGVIEKISLNLNQNHFSGSLYLPDTLSTGYLEIIAFTNWMRNFDESFFSKKTILVVNRFDKNLDFLKTDVLPENQARLGFFAEGGQLITGLEQTIFITSLPELPLPHALITLYSDNGDSLQTLILNKFGWATTQLIPEAGKRYFATVKGLDKRFYLPEPGNPGFLLQIKPLYQAIQVTIATNSPAEKKVNLVIRRNGRVFREYPISISNREAVFKEILKSDLDQGLYIFTLFGQNGDVLAERNWYVDKTDVAKATISLNKTEFGAREEVRLLIQLEDTDDAIEWATVSVMHTTTKAPPRKNLYLFLQALDLMQEKGISQNDALRYMSILNEEDLNDLLIMPLPQKTRSASNPKTPFQFYRETSHITLTGSIMQTTSQIPVNEARIILNSPDTIVNLLYSNSNQEGLFHFFLDSYFDDREIFLTPDPGTVSGNVSIEIFDKFDFKTPFDPDPLILPAAFREAITESQQIAELNKVFGISAQIEKQERDAPNTAPRIFSSPVYTINTDQFIPLDDLREIAREIIGPWRIRITRAGTSHTLISLTTSNAINGTPILFIDGIFTSNIEPLLPLSSRQISTIQILNLEWKHGDMHFPGIVAVFTKNEEFRNLKLQPAPLRFFNTAHQFPSKLSSLSYKENASQPSQPDLRQLLFWFSGKLETESSHAEFSWYTGDLPVNYTIYLEGKTRKGALLKFEIPLLYED